MYDRFILTKSLAIQAYVDLPKCPSAQVETKFLQGLINAAIEKSEITQSDVQSAIESCGVLDHDDLGMYTADEIVEKLRDTGNKLVGTLTHKQAMRYVPSCCKVPRPPADFYPSAIAFWARRCVEECQGEIHPEALAKAAFAAHDIVPLDEELETFVSACKAYLRWMNGELVELL